MGCNKWLILFFVFLFIPVINAAPPTVSFVSPTPANASVQSENSIYVNLSTTYSGDHYSFVNKGRSLIGWWTMDSANSTSVFDQSGYSHNGTYPSGITLNSSGRFGNATSFNGGSNVYITVPRVNTTLGSQRGQPFTISAWANSLDVSSRKLWALDSASYDISARVFTGGVVRFCGANSGTCTNTVSSSAIGEWFHFVATYNGSDYLLYLNGTFDRKITGITDLGNMTEAYEFRISDSSSSMNGSIDEVLLFNRSLDATEIQALYNSSQYQYSRNFTSLTNGLHRFKGYAVSSTGETNSTSDREIIIGNEIYPPSVNLIYPTNNFGTTSAANNFFANFTDNSGLANSTFYLWNSTSSLINQTTSTITGTSNTTNLSVSLPYQGVFYWNYLAKDNSSNSAFASSNFTINYDPNAPTVTINYPTNTTYTSLPLLFNVSLNENGSVWFNLNSGENISMSSTDNRNFNYTNSSIADGSYTFRVFANDSVGNNNFTQSVVFSVNQPSLSVSYSAGTESNGSTFSRDWIYVNVSISADDFANITYFLYNSTGQVNITTYSSQISNINWTSLSDGTYYYNVTIKDTLGFSNSTSTRTIILDNTAPTISEVNYTVFGEEVDVRWVTNEDSNSSVNYGLISGQLTSQGSVSSSVLQHRVRLTGLNQNVTYYYNVTSCDGQGFCSHSSQYNFTTGNVIYADLSLSSNCPGTYSISERDCSGSDGRAYVLLQNASDQLFAGDTVYIRGGRYNVTGITDSTRGNISVRFINDGTPNKYLSYRAYPGEEVIIDGSEHISSWTQCSSQASCGNNSNWSDIYYADILSSDAVSVNIYQADRIMSVSQRDDPDDPHFWNLPENWTTIPSGNFTNTTIQDYALLNQTDSNFWNGSYVLLWTGNNEVYVQKVLNFIPSNSTIVFESVGSSNLLDPGNDKYTMFNHISLINNPGEYYLNESSGRVFAWPYDNSTLENITYSVRDKGFDLRGRDYVLIENLNFKGYKGPGITNYNFGSSTYSLGILVMNNTVFNNRGGNIDLYGLNHSLVAYNHVYNSSSSEDDGRGIEVKQGLDVNVTHNYIYRTGRTAIYFSEMDRSFISNNTVRDAKGLHGNGITVYQNSANVYVLNNTVINSNIPLTIQSSVNLTIAYNLLEGSNQTSQLVAGWSGNYPSVGGAAPYDIIFENNTIVGSSTSSAGFYIHSAYYNVTVRNNIIDSDGITELNITHNSNLFLKNTTSYTLSSYNESYETNFSKVFYNRTGEDYRLLCDLVGVPSVNPCNMSSSGGIVGAFAAYSESSGADTNSPGVVLSSPSNNSNVTSSSQTFSASFSDDVQLANSTFFLWNSTSSLINQTTSTITGTSNTTDLSVTLPYTGVFYWNYVVADNSSNNAMNSSNFTITYSSSNSSSSSSSSSSGGGGGGGGGATDTGFWTTTYAGESQGIEDINQVEKELGTGQRIKVIFENEDHYVGVISLTGTIAVINVSSIPQQRTFNIGDSHKFELDGDNYYDLLVTLRGINNSKADVAIRYLHELFVPEVEEQQEAEQESDSENVVNEVVETASDYWLYGVIGAGVLVLVVVWFIIYKTRPPHKRRYEPHKGKVGRR